jgi:NADPH2 dehydrogenase
MTLFEPLTLGELEIRNRIMMSPMSQRAASEDGRADDWHLVHYGSRAVGGCGLVMVEDTAVSPLGRTSRRALGLYTPEQAEALGRIVSFCHAQGAVVGVQLAHAGRKAFADSRGGVGSVSASPEAFAPGWVAPLQASTEDLASVVGAFAGATRLASDAGFDVIEVHAAHGYLLHQFLSPLTNFRDDAYGGDGQARMRLLLEVVGAVRAQWPAGRPLFVRLPAGDGPGEGLGIGEMVECAYACMAAGADLIDISGGTPLLEGSRAGTAEVLALAAALTGDLESRTVVAQDRGATTVSAQVPCSTTPAQAPGSRTPSAQAPGSTTPSAQAPGSTTPSAQAPGSTTPSAQAPGSTTSSAQASGLPVALGGGIVDGQDAEELLRDRKASLVSVGRPLLADPYWPVRAAIDLGVAPPLPAAYADALREEESISSRAFGGAVFSPDHSKHVDGRTRV